ncbi:putative ABC bile acid transporter [Corchorus olitorius]|uniref:ABC bile acid transporter n=1 Tax=Corchorus olitorius TaxID=93759 RepID=A0A1R3IE81_9ROSI|nr:putative ABC bile acid transporter [Corchorus olitorius]
MTRDLRRFWGKVKLVGIWESFGSAKFGGIREGSEEMKNHGDKLVFLAKRRRVRRGKLEIVYACLT